MVLSLPRAKASPFGATLGGVAAPSAQYDSTAAAGLPPLAAVLFSGRNPLPLSVIRIPSIRIQAVKRRWSSMPSPRGLLSSSASPMRQGYENFFAVGFLGIPTPSARKTFLGPSGNLDPSTATNLAAPPAFAHLEIICPRSWLRHDRGSNGIQLGTFRSATPPPKRGNASEAGPTEYQARATSTSWGRVAFSR